MFRADVRTLLKSDIEFVQGSACCQRHQTEHQQTQDCYFYGRGNAFYKILIPVPKDSLELAGSELFSHQHVDQV